MAPFQLSEIKKLNGRKFKFHQVIEQIEGHKVIKFDGDAALLAELRRIAGSIVALVNSSKGKDAGFPERPNEFGNYVERFFREEMARNRHDCTKPKSKESGYPDCLLAYGGKSYYIEIKTCESNSMDSSFRSFFYSPSESSKIDRDAVHLLIGFKTIKNQLQLTGDIMITDLYDKEVALKLEYNSNNKELYKPEELL